MADEERSTGVLTIETTDRQLGELVRAMRKARDLNQTQIGQAIGRSRSAMQSMEGGQCAVSMKHLVGVATRCGYEIVMTIRPVSPPTTEKTLP